MGLNKRIQKDRSGVATIILALIIIAVIGVSAAAAAIVLLNGGDENNENGNGGGAADKIWGPGTFLRYDQFDDNIKIGATEIRYLGQNADESLVKVTVESEYSEYDFTVCSMIPKVGGSEFNVPEDAINKGKETIKTFEGNKKLDVFEYMEETMPAKAYIDSAKGLLYKLILGEEATEVIELTAYDLKWQTSYTPSDAIGTIYNYGTPTAGYTATIEVVADCPGGQYGIKYTVPLGPTPVEEYFVSANIRGLPIDAENTNKTETIGTIHGGKNIEIWTIPIGGSIVLNTNFLFYYEATSHYIYEIGIEYAGDTICLYSLKAMP
ncbi:MAG: hypothetical protein LBP82_00320 [Candidatus Methanoplasma sp.]|jgi:hypothetical protein|nr:hypothetical protein [Candidatus Methanoplasma sp.]